MKNLSPSKGFSRGLIGKVEEILGHGIEKSVVFQNTLTADIDKFVKTIGPELRDAWVKMLEARFQDFIGVFSIPVNYYEPEAIAKAIAAAGFDWKLVGLESAKIPLIGTGQVTQEVHEVHFGRVMYNRDLPEALKKRGQELGFKGGFKFADPLTVLRLACANPDRQRKHPLVILFTDKDGRLWYLYLREHDGQRYLDVRQNYPDYYWREFVRFLAVCELPLAA